MDFITGKHLPRRTFLQGMGASVALPFLDAMAPAGRGWAGAEAELDITRLVAVEMVHGAAGCNEWFGPAVWKSTDLGRSWSHSSAGLAYAEGEEPVKPVVPEVGLDRVALRVDLGPCLLLTLDLIHRGVAVEGWEQQRFALGVEDGLEGVQPFLGFDGIEILHGLLQGGKASRIGCLLRCRLREPTRMFLDIVIRG